MDTAIRGHFDGKVIILSKPVDLPRDRELEFQVRDVKAAPPLIVVSGQSLLRFSGTIEREDLEQMSQAIAEGCERVNGDEW